MSSTRNQTGVMLSGRGGIKSHILEVEELGAHSYEELRRHIGHKIVCVCYGVQGKDPENVAVECETCNEVLLSFDRGGTK